jgi:hypothetical protein
VPLPWLLRALGLAGEEGMSRGEVEARLELARAALRRLDELADEDWVAPELTEPLRGIYEQRAAQLRARLEPENGDGAASGDRYRRLRQELLAAERRRLEQLGHEGKLTTSDARRIERELDLEQTRLSPR